MEQEERKMSDMLMNAELGKYPSCVSTWSFKWRSFVVMNHQSWRVVKGSSFKGNRGVWGGVQAQNQRYKIMPGRGNSGATLNQTAWYWLRVPTRTARLRVMPNSGTEQLGSGSWGRNALGFHNLLWEAICITGSADGPAPVPLEECARSPTPFAECAR